MDHPSHPPGDGHGAEPGDHADPGLARLAHAVDHAAHLLPAQGPITVFIHHNTLHAFEDLPFEEAVKKGAQVFGCHPYMTEDRYRDELNRGRVRFDELQEVLAEDLGPDAAAPVPCFGTRLDLRLAMLQYPLRHGPTEELIWYVAEANAFQRVRREVSSAVRARLIAETRRWVMRDLRSGHDPSGNGNGHGNGSGTGPRVTARAVPPSLADLLGRYGESTVEAWTEDDWEGFTLQALWRVCCDGVAGLPPYTSPPPQAVRHRDLLMEATGADSDALVHPLLIRFCAAYIDQGLASWALPRRDEGFYAAFLSLYRQPGGPPDLWMTGLPAELARLQDAGVGPLESIRESLEILGVAESEWDDYLSATLLALRGWAGMVRQTEVRGDRVPRPAPAGSLLGFVAVRLVLDRFALAAAARQAIGYDGPLAGLRDAVRGDIPVPWPPSVEQRAFLVFQLAQLHGLSPDVLYRLARPGWASLVEEIEAFNPLERRRVFHLAYERRFYTQTLDAIALHATRPTPTPESPKFQAIFCIDERQESIRRHVEELAPEAETFGTAGFFSVAMYYRGAADAHYVPLCPPVIVPGHWVAERVDETHAGNQRLRDRARRALGRAMLRFHTGSRGLTLGAVLAAAVGVLASVPLVGRVLFPRLTSRFRRRVGSLVFDPPATRLHLERSDPAPGPDGPHVGFSLDEMTAIAEKVLREVGLPGRFSRLVLLFGHGSTSMNNPHESAYDCGACGGARGGPNARALAQMLNDPRVRGRLAARGLVVPETTRFVGGMHNTSTDTFTFFDLDRLPESHRDEFRAARATVEKACERDAHERCRRFQSAPLTLTFPGARQHVEGRSEDLAQVRPEWGHMTNAISVVGRRSFTRGLFLDRRSFLTSYDPTQDGPDTPVLARILGAVFPVCAGISLEYYFSHVDNFGYGSGTKLPHNIAGLLGVMDGAASDLRTGLPWQMVEYHEPVRLLFLIESTPAKMDAVMDANPVVGRLCRNGWVRLALIDPETREVSEFRRGAFQPYKPRAAELPQAASSVDWYRGWRDHLEFAEIGG